MIHKTSVNRNSLINNRDDGISRQGPYKHILSLINMFTIYQRSKGKHKMRRKTGIIKKNILMEPQKINT